MNSNNQHSYHSCETDENNNYTIPFFSIESDDSDGSNECINKLNKPIFVDNYFLDQYNLELVDHKVKLFRFYPDLNSKKSLIGFILPYFYTSKFFNITQDENEFTLILDEESAIELQQQPMIQPFLHQTNDSFYILKIFDEKERINEPGIVCKISRIFAEHQIPILFINSFSQNFVFIPEDKLELCKHIKTIFSEK